VWAHSPDIFTPDKLRPATSPSCLDYKQLAMPMVHPTTGETISSYKKLMHDPATAETWQTAFGKDFGGMAQGDNKTGQKGTHSIFVMLHDKIKKIPTNQKLLTHMSWSIFDRKKWIPIKFASMRAAT
jgi:hypothetical protein